MFVFNFQIGVQWLINKYLIAEYCTLIEVDLFSRIVILHTNAWMTAWHIIYYYIYD